MFSVTTSERNKLSLSLLIRITTVIINKNTFPMISWCHVTIWWYDMQFGLARLCTKLEQELKLGLEQQRLVILMPDPRVLKVSKAWTRYV